MSSIRSNAKLGSAERSELLAAAKARGRALIEEARRDTAAVARAEKIADRLEQRLRER